MDAKFSFRSSSSYQILSCVQILWVIYFPGYVNSKKKLVFQLYALIQLMVMNGDEFWCHIYECCSSGSQRARKLCAKWPVVDIALAVNNNCSELRPYLFTWFNITARERVVFVLAFIFFLWIILMGKSSRTWYSVFVCMYQYVGSNIFIAFTHHVHQVRSCRLGDGDDDDDW